VGAKSGQTKKQAGASRLGLIVFAVVFVLIFAGFAIADGLSGPSVPSGDVALVQQAPENSGHISEAEYKRAFARQVAENNLKKPPKDGSTKAEELKEAALGELLNLAWVSGEGEELGITVTEKQIENELANIKKQNFPTPKAYAEFLKTSHYSQEEINQRVELQILSAKIQEQVQGEVNPPSSAEISAYYEAEKEAKFTEKQTRDVRVIVNKDKGEVEKAKEALEKDNSPASWKKVAAKYSSDPTTNKKGGLQKAIPEELLQGELKEAIYGSATNELVGPINYQGQYLLIEVVALNPEKVKSLGEVRSEISKTLTEQIQQEFFAEFVAEFQTKWTSRTICASGYEIQQCSNFKGLRAPQKEFASCFEANPKTPPTECPAPVTQTKPALPGSVTQFKPGGEEFVQRPRPEETSEKASSAGGNSEALEKAVEEAGE
jgi:parvulin-like peptidyl-prolyl isomerase